MALIKLAALLGLFLVASSPVAEAASRKLLQTVPGTNVLKADLSSRSARGAQTLTPGNRAAQQVSTQAAIRSGVRTGTAATPDRLGTLAATRAAGRASPATRAALGTTAAQGAVRTAVRTNNAAAGTKAGAGIAEVATQGRGQTITNQSVRSSLAASSTSAAVQRAARGQSSVASATRQGQSSAQAAMINTSFGPTTGVGARANRT